MEAAAYGEGRAIAIRLHSGRTVSGAKLMMGVVSQAAIGTSERGLEPTTFDVRGKTHLIARLYGAGQLDGVLKMQRFKRVGVNSCRFGTDRGTGRNMQRLRRRRMRCFDASFDR